MNLEPPLKRLRPTKLNPNTCILCNTYLPTRKGSDYKTVVRNPTIASFSALFDAAKKRKDDVHDRILSFKYDILSGKIPIAFHKSCRASYTSKSNLQYVRCADDPRPASCLESTIPCVTREDTSSFSIRRDYFMCGNVYQKGRN